MHFWMSGLITKNHLFSYMIYIIMILTITFKMYKNILKSVIKKT